MRLRACGACILVVIGTACDDGAAIEPVQIASATPAYGPLVGGTRITLAGTGFSSRGAASRVFIAGREAPLAATLDDSTLDVVIPPGDRPGDAELVLINGNGNGLATGVFHYSEPPTITSVSPADVLFSSSSTVVTVTGTGFVDEDAGDVTVVVDGQLATDVRVTADTALTFTAPPGRALVRPDVEVVDRRGTATRRLAFRYTPSSRGGLLVFPKFGGSFAVLFDPVDNSTVAIPRVGAPAVRFTAVVVDELGDYWGLDRNWRFGRIDMKTQQLEAPLQTPGWFPTMVRVGTEHFAIERGALRFGKLDVVTGSFTTIGTEAIPCCGSYGLASDGTTLHFTARQGAAVTITTIDATTGVAGTPVTIAAGPGFHVEEMRFFDGALYASSRDGTLVVIDPATGATAVLPVSLGRSGAMEVFE